MIAWGRSVAIACATTLALPATAVAASPEDGVEGEAGAPEDDLVAQAESLYDKGAAKFETADYRAAIELWTEAYEMVPDSPGSGRIKALLIYNIATARERAYDVNEDVVELRQAKILLQRFADVVDELYAEDERAAERERVQDKIAELDAKIAAATGDEGDPVDTRTPDPPPPPTDDKPGRPLVISGVVLLGVGAAGLGLMAAGLGIGAGANDISGLDPMDIPERRDQFDRGRLGNGLAYGGGIGGGVFAVTGAILLGLGMAKNKRAASTTAAAWLGEDGGGLSIAGRF